MKTQNNITLEKENFYSATEILEEVTHRLNFNSTMFLAWNNDIPVTAKEMAGFHDLTVDILNMIIESQRFLGVEIGENA